MTPCTVYSWVSGPTDLLDTPTTQPALRVWGDAILELRADQREMNLAPPVSTRRTALFAWVDPLPPEDLARVTAERRRVQLEVDQGRCAVARVDLIDAAFHTATWRALAEHLVDSGFDREFLEEEIVVLADPMATMLIDRGVAAVASTSHDLLQSVVGYFAPIVDPYLNSWTTFSGLQPVGGGSWEIVIPRDALLGVREG